LMNWGLAPTTVRTFIPFNKKSNSSVSRILFPGRPGLLSFI
jgi:hypothetical protein